MTKYIVETISSFRHRYVIEADSADKAIAAANHHVEHGNLIEFSQKHIAESISDCREISEEEILTAFDRDNDYIREWPNSKKLSLINKI